MLRERFDHRLEQRLESFLEPRIHVWLHRFFRSARGERLLGDIFGDFLVSWLKPGAGESSVVENTLISAVSTLAQQDAEFRNKIIHALNPHLPVSPDAGHAPSHEPR